MYVIPCKKCENSSIFRLSVFPRTIRLWYFIVQSDIIFSVSSCTPAVNCGHHLIWHRLRVNCHRCSAKEKKTVSKIEHWKIFSRHLKLFLQHYRDPSQNTGVLIQLAGATKQSVPCGSNETNQLKWSRSPHFHHHHVGTSVLPETFLPADGSLRGRCAAQLGSGLRKCREGDPNHQV